MADDPAPEPKKAEQGTWIDVYSLHFPAPEPTHKGPLRENLGLDGYDRKAGVEVPTKPVLKGKGDTEPKADPFAKKH